MGHFIILVLMASVLISSTVQAQKNPYCFAATGVSVTTPYLLTFKNSDISQISKVAEDINKSALLNVSNWFTNLDIMTLNVKADPSVPASEINEAAFQELIQILNLNNIPENGFAVECNRGGSAL